MIIRFEFDPVTLSNGPCALGRQLILTCFDISYTVVAIYIIGIRTRMTAEIRERTGC